jgi:hypothetical protein
MSVGSPPPKNTCSCLLVPYNEGPKRDIHGFGRSCFQLSIERQRRIELKPNSGLLRVEKRGATNTLVTREASEEETTSLKEVVYAGRRLTTGSVRTPCIMMCDSSQ